MKYFVPTKIIEIGENIELLLNYLPLKQNKRLGFITGKDFLDKSGIWEEFQRIFKDYEIFRFKVYKQNPSCEVADECKDFLRSNKINIVIAVGGGSVLDVAKAASLLARNDGLCKDFLMGNKNPKNRGLPIIAIPTTTGTGSEVTPFAVFSLKNIKKTLESEFLFPDYAILFSSPLRFLPKQILAITAIDALCHAIEAYWARNSNFISDKLAIESIKLNLKNLKKAYDGNLLNRYELLKASCLAGLAFSNTRTTICHALSYPMTALYSIPHGLACGITLIPIMLRNYYANTTTRGKLKLLLGAIGLTTIEDFCSYLKDLFKAMNLKMNFREHNLTEEDLEIIAENAFSPERMKNNPVEFSKEEILEILEEVY